MWRASLCSGQAWLGMVAAGAGFEIASQWPSECWVLQKCFVSLSWGLFFFAGWPTLRCGASGWFSVWQKQWLVMLSGFDGGNSSLHFFSTSIMSNGVCVVLPCPCVCEGRLLKQVFVFCAWLPVRTSSRSSRCNRYSVTHFSFCSEGLVCR